MTKAVQEVHLDKQVRAGRAGAGRRARRARQRGRACLAGPLSHADHRAHRLTSPQVTLLDSPGVVFADAGADGAAAAALRNAVKAEQLPDPALPVAEIVRRCPAKQLMKLYKVAAFKGADAFLQLVAQVGAPGCTCGAAGRRS